MTAPRGREDLQRIADAAGFRIEMVETVARLLDVLSHIAANPFLRDRVALKGGTAINLFELAAPRLSVDIDLNHIGSPDRAVAEAEWPDIHRDLAAACGAAGVRSTGSARTAAALWSFTGRFFDGVGRRQKLKVDLNHQHRVPLWPTRSRDSIPLHGLRATGIPVVDVHELCAGKLVALLDRGKPRDVFDAPRILELASVDPERVRKAVVVLSAGTRNLDLRGLTELRPRVRLSEMREQLRPVVHVDAATSDEAWDIYSERLLDECEQALTRLLPVRDDEREFLDRLLDHGEVHPEALFAPDDFRERVRHHPTVRFRAENVRRIRGL